MTKLYSVVLASFLSSNVIAADFPTKAFAPLPLTDPFTGVYIGAAAGYGMSISPTGMQTGQVISDVGGTTNAPHGFIGGVYGGYGTRIANSFYAGIEANIDAGRIAGTGTIPPPIPGAQLGLITTDKWLASGRVRAGYILPNGVLLFGTVGYGAASASLTVEYAPTQVAPIVSQTTSGTLSGIVYGGGIEFPLWGDRLLGRAQYLHYSLGTQSVVTPFATFSQKNDIDIVQGGISYKF